MAKIKLLDYWAPWCVDPETLVLTESGYLKASQIRLGMKLVTIHPKTQRATLKKVKKVRVFKVVPSMKITLETGRELIGDLNHLVLTKEGFKPLDNLILGEKLLVDPITTSLVYASDKETTILETTGDTFSDHVLENLNLLHLKINDPRLPILARLLGFVVTDGYLYEDLKRHIHETHFFVGTEEDAWEIKNDLKLLGFEKLEIKRLTKERSIKGRDFMISCIRCRSFSKALFYLLKALGSPVGRKKSQVYFIPDWVMAGERTVKKEFLSGWLGGDGCKISYYTKYQGASSHYAGFRTNVIEFHKEKDLEKEGILYARQLAQLLEELEVRVSSISSIDDEDGVIISLRIFTDYYSLLNLTKIGYSYSTTKNHNVAFIKEFLQYRLFERKYYTNLKQIALQQLSLGVSNRVISQNIQVPVGTVVSWRYNKKAQVTHPRESGQAKFEEWSGDRQQEDLLWEKISLIEDAKRRDVIGITVESPHTLVTNGIVSHNCGPCRQMAPVLEEIEKELGDKVEVKKINVDERPDEAAKHGVMSIPTYIIMKEGKEVARKIGVTPKAELFKLLQS